MKKMIAVLVLLGCMCGMSVAEMSDEDSIKTVISKAYVEGLQNWGDLSYTKKGFDPTFNLLIQGKDGSLQRYAIKDWIENIEKKKAEHPEGPKDKTTVNFVSIDITGTAAVAKIELFKKGKRIFTDYLSLYKFKDGWRIVSKIYFRY